MNHVLHVAPIAESPTSVAPGSGSASSRRDERETALDTLRSFATVRVMVWHAFGIAAITYLVAAMPAMFFVTGTTVPWHAVWAWIVPLGDPHGSAWEASVGHFGGTTLVAYVAAGGLTVVIDVTDTLWVDGRPESIGALVAALGALAARL